MENKQMCFFFNKPIRKSAYPRLFVGYCLNSGIGAGGMGISLLQLNLQITFSFHFLRVRNHNFLCILNTLYECLHRIYRIG